jgi:putative tricarboxylic transport membrane protein
LGVVELVHALLGLMTPEILFSVFWATFLGIIVGMLPGLTATMGIALLTGLTYQWESSNAIVILIAMYVGAIYGGSRSAILVNIPGTPANAATCIDGHPLALQGKAGEAIGIATTSSFLGSTIALFFMAFFTPYLGLVALRFQSFEFFWLTLFGVLICGNLTAPEDPLKGWISGFLGLFLAMIGMEAIQAYPRFAYGTVDLYGGVSMIPALVGIYGMTEVIQTTVEAHRRGHISQVGRVLPRIRDLLRNWKNIIRSGLIGVFVGTIPGVGENIASFVAYDFARRGSKTPEKFGKGSVEGLTAAETGDNACVGGAIIPVLVLAVPGSPPAAVLLAAMWLHGMRPGPLLVIEAPHHIFEVSAMFLLASLAMLILGLSMVRIVVKILKVPTSILMPIILVLCTVGSFAIAGRVFDILIMLLFGVIGYPLRKMKFPDAPLILGLILGPMLDENLRRGLILNDGSLVPFFTRPISVILIIMILMTVFSRNRYLKQTIGRARDLVFTPLRKFKGNAERKRR